MCVMRRSRLPVLLLVAATAAPLVLTALSGAAETRRPLDELEGGDKVRSLIDRVVEHQRAVHSLRARFTQVKESDMLLDPVVSTGEFSFRAPDQVRWDYEAPEPMVVLFSDDVVTTFHPQHNRAERVKISSRHRRFVRVLAGTQPLDDLSRQFTITFSDRGEAAPYRLTLVPNAGFVSRKLESVILDIDRQLMLPVMVQYDETDGDSTRYEFRGMEVNPKLEESLFHLELGSDVVVEKIDLSAGAV